jgi:hypothetical protein
MGILMGTSMCFNDDNGDGHIGLRSLTLLMPYKYAGHDSSWKELDTRVEWPAPI